MEPARRLDSVLFPVSAADPAVEARRRMPASVSSGGPLRVIGPGRRERSYLERVDRLDAELAAARSEGGLLAERVVARERELALADRVERGSQRRLDRLEDRLATAEQQKARLALALGALQRENERLRARIASGRTELALSGPAAPNPAASRGGAVSVASARARRPTRAHGRAGFWSRLLGSRGSRSQADS